MANKIALVTGGSRGLGRDMCLALADKHIDIILTYNQRREEGEKVQAELEKKGVKAAILQLDASDSGSFDGFADAVKKILKEKFGADRFDFLVNNAGFALYKPFGEVTETEFDGIVNVHFKGPYLLTQKLLPFMNDGGGIVNVSSGLARMTLPGSSAYAAVKAAMETVTRYQAQELGVRKIRSNVVAPGAIETDFGGGRVRDNAEMNQMLAARTALGRVGKPDDIGGVVAFLCTTEAKWINAQRIEVSGGQNL